MLAVDEAIAAIGGADVLRDVDQLPARSNIPFSTTNTSAIAALPRSALSLAQKTVTAQMITMIYICSNVCVVLGCGMTFA